MGFSMYRRLENFGYQTYPKENAQCQMMEVYPQACFTVLLGVLPFAKNTIEGRMQRQLVLYQRDLNIPDPMRFFKEITRKRLLNGLLPHGNLYQPEELDALVAAYTAWLSKYNPDQITLFGDPDEGQVVIPAAELKDKYT
jgi:predicted RNase H-like nuclease